MTQQDKLIRMLAEVSGIKFGHYECKCPNREADTWHHTGVVGVVAGNYYCPNCQAMGNFIERSAVEIAESAT